MGNKFLQSVQNCKYFTTWTEAGNQIMGEAGENAGHSVDLSADGTELIVGSPGSEKSTVYRYDGASTWDQVGNPIINSNSGSTAMHVALSSDGTRIAISETDSSDNGVVHMAEIICT